MAESGIEIDIDQYLTMDEMSSYDGQFGELKSSSFVDKPLKTEVKHASTPLKVNLKMQLMKQQMQDEQQRLSAANTPHRAAAISQSNAINMPVTVSALTSDIPQQVTQVKSGLLHPTRYHVQQKRKDQIQSFLSQSVTGSHMMGHHNSMPVTTQPQMGSHHTPTHHSPAQYRQQHYSSSSMPDPTSPLSVMSSGATSCGSVSEVDDILGDILGLEQVDTSGDQDLGMLLQLSSTAPHDNIASGPLTPTDSNQTKQTSASAPAPNELLAWCKDRQRKDNHNQIERKRRYNINDRIKELGTLLPNTSDPDFRQNKGTILKASVDYIRDLKQDQQKLRRMEDRMKEQERQNRLIMLRLQQCEMMLKQTGLTQNPGMGGVALPITTPVIKSEPVQNEAMEDDLESPIANDPMLSASLTNTPDFSIDDAMSGL